MNYTSIGKNIRQYRLERKMKQDTLAEKTNLSPNYISMIERGEKFPSLETFISILNALEVSSDLILHDVLNTGYEVKNSILTEKLSKITPQDRQKIYAVIDTMIKYSKTDYTKI